MQIEQLNKNLIKYIDFIYYEYLQYNIEDILISNKIYSIQSDSFFRKYNNVDVYINKKMNIFYIKEKVIQLLYSNKKCILYTATIIQQPNIDIYSFFKDIKNININMPRFSAPKIIDKKYFLQTINQDFFITTLFLQKPIKFILNNNQIYFNNIKLTDIQFKDINLTQQDLPYMTVVHKYNLFLVKQMKINFIISLLYNLKYVSIKIDANLNRIYDLPYYCNSHKQNLIYKELYNNNIFSVRYLEEFNSNDI